ncbi:MAG: cell division protein FtsA [Prevotella sp.]|nr:cell division protein FtsA [Prevotella sp.]
MAKEIIIAIELGSSKITGIAGKKNQDGSISVLNVVKEDASQCIRKGTVYNIEKTSQCITNITAKLKNALKSEIARVYVGVGGQSIRSIKNVIVKDFATDTTITQDMVNELMDTNRNMNYPDQEILDAAVQEYKVGAQYQMEPVGINTTRLEGNFLNILYRRAFYRNLNQCFDSAGIQIADIILAPVALADAILTENEKRIGCLLVDLGADTTTVAVYHKNVLRHLAVIPLGCNNITKDIAALQMIEESEAETLKIANAQAFTDDKDINDSEDIEVKHGRPIPVRTFIEIVESRIQEIIKNVWNQVPDEYTNKLIGGIILTGGGANMKNIETAFKNITEIDKIRVARFVTHKIMSKDQEINSHNCMMNTILALLIKGDHNCVGEDLNSDLFNSGRQARGQQADNERVAREK